IDTTIDKTVIALAKEENQLLFKEIKLRVKLALNQITLEDYVKEMAEDINKAIERNKEFDSYFAKGSECSSKSLLVEAKYNFEKALILKPWSREAISKLKAIDKRIQERINKGETINWVIEVEG